MTPRLVNEAGYSYSHGAILSQPVGSLSERLSPDINPNLPKNVSGRAPSLSFFSGQQFGFGTYRDINTNHSASEIFTWVFGRHIAKYGLVYHHYEKSEGAFFRTDNGIYNFLDIGPTGNSFQQEWANFLLGNVTQIYTGKRKSRGRHSSE